MAIKPSPIILSKKICINIARKLVNLSSRSSVYYSIRYLLLYIGRGSVNKPMLAHFSYRCNKQKEEMKQRDVCRKDAIYLVFFIQSSNKLKTYDIL